MYNNSISQIHGANKAHNINDKAPQQKGDEANVIALAYYYLIEAATSRSETALVQAKQLKANSSDQQRLNKEAAQLQWDKVPKLDGTHHSKIIRHGHWHWKFWHHGFHYYTRKEVTWTTHKNQAEVNNAQAQNDQIAAERQYLTQQMGVLTQLASVGETHVNSVSNESVQTMQEGSKIMSILQSLTFKALIRRQI